MEYCFIYIEEGYLPKLGFKLVQVGAELSQAQSELGLGLKKFGHGDWAKGNMFYCGLKAKRIFAPILHL